MADKKYYAQFDGDEVDGKIYALGEPLKDSVDVGTITYLVGMGRIGSTPPSKPNKDAGDLGLPDDSDPRTAQLRVLADLDPMDMTREELVAHIAELATAEMGDDQIREAIFLRREANAEDAKRGDAGGSKFDGADGGADETGGRSDVTDDDVRLRAILGGKVDDVNTTVAEFTDKAKLARLRELEVEGKDRAGVKTAIDDRVASLEA